MNHCVKCGKPASHDFGGGMGKYSMCCVCYVKAGNPPADWHPECMLTYKAIAKAENN